MDIKTWRTEQKLTLAALAARLQIRGPNPARNLHRVETGENRADADLVAAIERLTEGSVDAAAMNATRLAWLQAKGRARDFAPSAGEAA